MSLFDDIIGNPVEGRIRHLPLIEILKTPDETNYEQRHFDDDILVDSRFGDIWLRVIAHMVVEDVKKKRLRNEWNIICFCDSQMEEWECYIATEIMSKGYPDKYDKNLAFTLF